MSGLQVIQRTEHKNRSLAVEFVISSKQVQGLNIIMALAGIDKRSPGSHWGWDWDPVESTCFIIVPWMYRGKIDRALKMVADRWYPSFKTGLQIKQEVEA